MVKMWILLTYKNGSNESESTRDCIGFGLFFFFSFFFSFFYSRGGGGGGGRPPDPLDCASAMQMRMSRRLCQRSIDSSTRKNFPLFFSAISYRLCRLENTTEMFCLRCKNAAAVFACGLIVHLLCLS